VIPLYRGIEDLDLPTTVGVDIRGYPDSNKINILPYLEIFESSAKVDYYKGEEDVKTNVRAIARIGFNPVATKSWRCSYALY